MQRTWLNGMVYAKVRRAENFRCLRLSWSAVVPRTMLSRPKGLMMNFKSALLQRQPDPKKPRSLERIPRGRLSKARLLSLMQRVGTPWDPSTAMF